MAYRFDSLLKKYSYTDLKAMIPFHESGMKEGGSVKEIDLSLF